MVAHRTLIALTCVTACATATPQASALVQQKRLAGFSSALAQAGLSVPLPPRICQEPPPHGAARATFDDDIGCVAASEGAQDSDVVIAYARAIVARRLLGPAGATDARADALAHAFLAGDPALATLAAAIELDFDAYKEAQAAGRAPPARTEQHDGGPLDGGE